MYFYVLPFARPSTVEMGPKLSQQGQKINTHLFHVSHRKARSKVEFLRWQNHAHGKIPGFCPLPETEAK